MSKKIAKFAMLAVMSAGIFLTFQNEANAQCGSKLTPGCGGSTFVGCYDRGCQSGGSGGSSCQLTFPEGLCECQ